LCKIFAVTGSATVRHRGRGKRGHWIFLLHQATF